MWFLRKAPCAHLSVCCAVLSPAYELACCGVPSESCCLSCTTMSVCAPHEERCCVCRVRCLRCDITHAVLLIAYLFLSVCTTRATSARPAVANSVVAIATGGKCVTGVLGGIREMPRGRRRGCGWYAPKRIAPTGAVFQPGRPNADFTTMMPVERQGGNADFFSN